MFNTISDTFRLKSSNREALLYLGMARVRFQRAARANGIQSRLSFSLYLYLMTDKLKNENVSIMAHITTEE